MKKNYGWWKGVQCALVAAALSWSGLGCENDSDDYDGVRFSNESSQQVRVYTSMMPMILADQKPSFELAPGEEHDVYYEHFEKVYYDYGPKDRVTANQVEDNHVIFVDK